MHQQDLTHGPIIKKLLLFAMPMMAGNLLQQLYNITDTIIVGRFVSAQALAAVGSAYSLMVFLTSVLIGMCMGSGNLYSISMGAGQKEQMKKDIWISFTFIAALTLIIYLCVYAGLDQILVLLQIPQDVFPLIRQYLIIVFAGIGFTSLYNFFAYILRSMGDSMIPFRFLVISSLCNIVLDLLFVIRFDMGIGGAALATVIAQAISGIGIMLYVMKKIPDLMPDFHKPDKFFHDIKDKERWSIIVQNDIATSAQQSVMNFGILMIQGLVNSFGTSVMAAFAAAVKIDTFAYMPAQEFANAFSLFISQNHGAGKKERIKDALRKSLAVSVTFCLTVSLLIWLLADRLMGIFVSMDRTDVIFEGVRYLRIEGAAYFGIGILFLWYAYYRGIQKPHLSLLLTIVSLGTRVLLSYCLAPTSPLGVVIIWISIIIGWLLADAVGLLLYHQGRGSRHDEWILTRSGKRNKIIREK